jgi:hypothetical protein
VLWGFNCVYIRIYIYIYICIYEYLYTCICIYILLYDMFSYDLVGMIGVDLSSKMLQKASNKECYGDLIVGTIW